MHGHEGGHAGRVARSLPEISLDPASRLGCSCCVAQRILPEPSRNLFSYHLDSEKCI